VDLTTGRVEHIHAHKKEIFAEGIAVIEDKIFQLTWKNNLIFEFNKDDFSLHTVWPFPRDGWGVTYDGKHLIISDGSASLYFLNPTTMEEQRVIEVHDQNGPVRQLNELEYVKDRVYANIYQQDRIAIINPEDGFVCSYVDLSALSSQVRNKKKAGVLNGIMYDAAHDKLFVTGKLWPSLFEIRLVPGDADNSVHQN
jgi:glutamine cyclotransferase